MLLDVIITYVHLKFFSERSIIRTNIEGVYCRGVSTSAVENFLSARIGVSQHDSKMFWTWHHSGFFHVPNPRVGSRGSSLSSPPKSDQLQISHHTVWRTWFFTPYSGGKWFRYQILTTSLIHLSLKGWENALFELGSERVKADCCTFARKSK